MIMAQCRIDGMKHHASECENRAEYRLTYTVTAENHLRMLALCRYCIAVVRSCDICGPDIQLVQSLSIQPEFPRR